MSDELSEHIDALKRPFIPRRLDTDSRIAWALESIAVSLQAIDHRLETLTREAAAIARAEGPYPR